MKHYSLVFECEERHDEIERGVAHGFWAGIPDVIDTHSASDLQHGVQVATIDASWTCCFIRQN